MAVTPKTAGARAGLPRPVEDHAISQNFHQILAEIDRLAYERERSTLPRFLWLDQVINPDGTVNVTLRLTDPKNRPGTLRAWVNKASFDAPDPDAPLDGTAALPVTPVTILPDQSFTLTAGGTGALLQNIKVPAASGKRIFLEFINDEGLSTGIRDFVLVGGGGIVDPGGTLKPGSITARDQFISSVQPIEIVNTLPATCTKDQVVVLATDGKLYRCTGGPEGWVAVVRAPDLTGVLTREQLEDEIINTAKIAQGLKLIRVVSTLPASGTAGETVSMGGMLYTWDTVALAWKSKAQSADLSGLIQGQQLVDAAINSARLADRAVINMKIGLLAVTSDVIASATIVGANIFGGTITSSLVQTRTLAADRIASNVLTTNEIAAAQVHGDRITANTLHADRIVTNSIDTAQIAAGAIKADQLAVGAVLANRIASNQIYAHHIVTGEIKAGHIAANQIDVGHIVAGGITADWLAANSITAAKIQAGAIGVSHINAYRMSNLAGTVGIAFDVPAGSTTGYHPNWTSYISFYASDPYFINHSQFKLEHAGQGGRALFYGRLEGATGTFSGALSAATGTFAGELSAASGTFRGRVELRNDTSYGTNRISFQSSAGSEYGYMIGFSSGEIQISGGGATVSLAQSQLITNQLIRSASRRVVTAVYSTSRPTNPHDGLMWVS